MISAATPGDTSVREFSHLVLSLRDDIRFTFGQFDGLDCYIVEDPLRSKFYRIGVSEYRFIAGFDGRRSVGDIIGDSARELGRDALGEHDAVVVVDWLLTSELALARGSFRTAHLMQGAEKRRDAKFLKSVNLMFLKLPLFNPTRLLSVLTPLMSWIFGGFAAFLWLAMIGSAVWIVLDDWARFASSSAGVFSSGNWIQLIIIWALLKLIHEFAHGVVCRRYGGDVLEAGVIFILFAPIGYVDATSAWRFGSKWQRMHTAAAGMYIEFLIAAIGVWVWATTADPYHAQMAQNLVLVASINTLLFNANPLMKFDGYYIFSDWLEVPNLYGRGQEYVKYVMSRWFLGLDVNDPAVTRRDRLIIGVYGFLSLLWRIVVVATLLIVAQTLFKGAGLIVAVVSAIILIGVPVRKLTEFLIKGNQSHKPRPLRFAFSLTLSLGVVWGVLYGIQVAPRVDAPGVMDFAKVETLRAQTQGFVQEVLVNDGEQVQAGDVLLRLENRELLANVEEIKIKLKQTELRRRTLVHAGDVAGAQADARDIETLRDSLRQHNELVDALTLRAETAGRVLDRNLKDLVGRFVNRGDALVALSGAPENEMRVSIAQENIASFRERIGESVDVRVSGAGTDVRQGELVAIEPRATSRVEHEALTALAGGSIKVRTSSSGDGYESIEPRFSGLVRIIDESLMAARPGQTAVISILSSQESIGALWYRFVQKWVARTIEVAQGVEES